MIPSLVEKGGEGGLLLIKNPGISWLRLVVPSKGPHLGLWVKLANGFEENSLQSQRQRRQKTYLQQGLYSSGTVANVSVPSS
jgi:hypothetical protein